MPLPRSSLQGPSASGSSTPSSQLIRPGLVTHSGLKWGAAANPHRRQRQRWRSGTVAVNLLLTKPASPEVCVLQSFSPGDRRALITLHYSCTCSTVGGGICHFRFAFVDPDFLELARRTGRANSKAFYMYVFTRGQFNPDRNQG